MKSWLEISRAHLLQNLRAVQSAAGADAEVLAVIKANGYGHDAARIAPVLVAGGARWLGVTDVEEGTQVRAALGDESSGQADARLLVMCGMEPADAPALVARRLTPVVWTRDHLAALEAAAKAAATPIAVHLELDTGMSRQGVAPGPALAAILGDLTTSRWIILEGVMSHLASSEVAGAAQTAQQLTLFGDALRQVAATALRPTFVHLANSSALDTADTLGWLRAQAQVLGARILVRPGLALFGYCLPVGIEGGDGAAAGHATLAPQLQPVLTWKTRLLDLREVPAGAMVGYGGTFTATSPKQLALLPVGYADGLRREASSGLAAASSRLAAGSAAGWVCIGGRRAPIVGRVSMNLTTVDVTALAGVAVGDEVVLLGEGVSAHDHARWCATIPYEILCGLRAPAILV